MKAIKLRPWDSAEHLKTEEEMVLYLEACLEDGDAAPAGPGVQDGGPVQDRARGTRGPGRPAGVGHGLAGGVLVGLRGPDPDGDDAVGVDLDIPDLQGGQFAAAQGPGEPEQQQGAVAAADDRARPIPGLDSAEHVLELGQA